VVSVVAGEIRTAIVSQTGNRVDLAIWVDNAPVAGKMLAIGTARPEPALPDHEWCA
jgi:hypothetical protein